MMVFSLEQVAQPRTGGATMCNGCLVNAHVHVTSSTHAAMHAPSLLWWWWLLLLLLLIVLLTCRKFRIIMFRSVGNNVCSLGVSPTRAMRGAMRELVEASLNILHTLWTNINQHFTYSVLHACGEFQIITFGSVGNNVCSLGLNGSFTYQGDARCDAWASWSKSEYPAYTLN
jgi:hypothetical protein